MFNINLAIDFIQSTKKQFVDATVTNDIIRKGLHTFVDKQTDLCKTITENMATFTKELVRANLPQK